jgi:hypothetical protein
VITTLTSTPRNDDVTLRVREEGGGDPTLDTEVF